MTTAPKLPGSGMPDQPWRRQMLPASFRGAGFHIELESAGGGRRIALHEYPKRNMPYAEDMGRRAGRFGVTGYLIGPGYITPMKRLISALNEEGPGQLVLSTKGTFTVACDTWSCQEFKDRGGMCTFEMQFVEAGTPGFSVVPVATQDAVQSSSTNNSNAGQQWLDNTLKQLEAGP